MKKLLFLYLCFALLLQSSYTKASCDIKPLATRYLNDLYEYIDGGLERPKLKIDNGKLESVDNIEIQQYKLGSSQKKYYVTAYTEGNKIKIYSRIFKLHDMCDKDVKGKLRNILVHEYTHYLDSFGDVSGIINTTDDEEAAITVSYTHLTLPTIYSV